MDTTTFDRVVLTGALRYNVVRLTDGPGIQPDFGAGNFFMVTLRDMRLLLNPVNAAEGQWGCIAIRQDAAGGHAIVFGTHYRFAGGKKAPPKLTKKPNALDVFSYIVFGAEEILLSPMLNWR